MMRHLLGLPLCRPIPFSLLPICPLSTAANDEYFAAVHHISNIVRRDIYLERTLNKLRIPLTNDLVYRILRSCSTHGLPSYRFFSWAHSHPSYSPSSLEFHQLIKTLASTRHWTTMWKVLHHLHHHHRHRHSLSADLIDFIIREYGRAGLIDDAVKLFNSSFKIFRIQHTVAIYNSLLFALCEGRNFQGAYALVRRMIRKGARPDRETYSLLVNAWCKAGKLAEAREFLEEMSRKGFNPPVRGREVLIHGLLSAGHIESAKALVKRMAVEEGYVPDVRTFNSVLEAVFRSGEVGFGIELCSDVCRMGLCPDLETYKIMIPVCARVGRMDEAFRLLHCSIEEGHKPFPSLYAPILKALCRAGRFDDGFSFFSDMKVKGHPPNRPVYTMLVRMCCRGGRFVEAANYLVEMTELNLVPLSQSFDMVTDGLKNCGKYDLARRIEHLEVSLRRV